MTEQEATHMLARRPSGTSVEFEEFSQTKEFTKWRSHSTIQEVDARGLVMASTTLLSLKSLCGGGLGQM